MHSLFCCCSNGCNLAALEAHLLERHVVLLEVLGVLQLVVGLWEVLVWGSVVLLVVEVGVALLVLGSGGVLGVQARQRTVVHGEVVGRGWLEVVQMGEAGRLEGSEVEDLLGESVVDTVWLLSVDPSEDVVLDDWGLLDDGAHGSGGLARDAVTEGEDVLEPLVLQSVSVDINQTSLVSDAGVLEPLPWSASWVHGGGGEVLLNSGAGVDVSESGGLDTVGILLDRGHLPSEVDLNASLLALIEDNLVGVWEWHDGLVWSDVHDAGSLGNSLGELVGSHQGFVVESVEIGTLTLVWESWGVGQKIATSGVVTIVEVPDSSLLAVEAVDEDIVVLVTLIEALEAWDVVDVSVEASSQDEGLVGELSAVVQGNLVALWIKGGHSVDVDHRPWVDNVDDWGRLEGEHLLVLVENIEVHLWDEVHGVLADDTHLEFGGILVLLHLLKQTGSTASA